MLLKISTHPRGLHPIEAVKAWQLKQEGETLQEIASQVVNLAGKRPCLSAVWKAIDRVDNMDTNAIVPEMKYHNCGRRKELTHKQEKDIIAFVKRWRSKRFCTCRYIQQELRLPVTPRTVGNILNRSGYFWRPVPKKGGLTKSDLQQRREFVAKYGSHTASWWEENMSMVLDGVTLTKAPKPLNAAQKHMAQSITHMWMKKGESLDNDVHKGASLGWLHWRWAIYFETLDGQAKDDQG